MLTVKTKRRMVLVTLCAAVLAAGGGCTNKQIGGPAAPTATANRANPAAPVAPTATANRANPAAMADPTATADPATPAPAGSDSPPAAARNASMLVADQPAFPNVKVYSETSGLVWVPLEETSKSINFNLHRDSSGISMGTTDPVYSVKVNRTQAFSGDQPIVLPQAPRLFENKPYMTTQALSALMGTPVHWNAPQGQVVLQPIDDGAMTEQQGAAAQQPGGTTGQYQSFAVTNVDKNSLLGYARNFLGTPYAFSAGSYESTHKFDCSSFVQHVYGHFGVNLPRTSRSQAQVGQTIDMNSLQPGDLMFFYTPGRYASNRIVGHVGIYAGNGRFINTWGDPGVTFSDFNSYWKGRFLFGKRVA